jgi:hypothetical protein
VVSFLDGHVFTLFKVDGALVRAVRDAAGGGFGGS